MKILGVLMIIAGVLLGLWAGLWWSLIGGIMIILTQVIDAIKTGPQVLEASVLGWGIARVVLAGFVGWGAACLLIIPGAGLMAASPSRYMPRGFRGFGR